MAYQQPSRPKDATSVPQTKYSSNTKRPNCSATEGHQSPAMSDDSKRNNNNYLDAFEGIFKAEVARNAAQMPPAAHVGAHGACHLNIPHWHDESGKTRASSLDVLRLLKRDFPLITERERIRRMLEFARIGNVRCILEDIHGREILSDKAQGIIHAEGEKSHKDVATASVKTHAIVSGQAAESLADVAAPGEATPEGDEEGQDGMAISGEEHGYEDDSDWWVVSDNTEEDWELMY